MARLTPDEAALLRAVCASPADDLPRLVYADYLDEHGRNERAEFIRVQCELLDPTLRGWRRTQLLGRAGELLRDHAPSWRRELPRWAWEKYPAGGSGPKYRRGFPAEMDLHASPFVRFGGELLDRVPLECVVLAHAGPVAGRLAAAGWLGRVANVDLSYSDLSGGRVAALTAGGSLAGVAGLQLEWCEVDDAGARALARCPALAGLKRLSLRGNNISRTGAVALAASPHLRGLKSLDLVGNTRLGADGDRVRGLFAGRPVVVSYADNPGGWPD